MVSYSDKRKDIMRRLTRYKVVWFNGENMSMMEIEIPKEVIEKAKDDGMVYILFPYIIKTDMGETYVYAGADAGGVVEETYTAAPQLVSNVERPRAVKLPKECFEEEHPQYSFASVKVPGGIIEIEPYGKVVAYNIMTGEYRCVTAYTVKLITWTPWGDRVDEAIASYIEPF